MELQDCLIETGLTRHEARLYLLLLREGIMSGYEAAKQSGISRSNTYLALAGLMEKGGAICVDGTVKRYAAVPVDEFCINKQRRLEQVLQTIQTLVPEEKKITEPFLTIRGKSHIIDKMRNLITGAKFRVYLALAPAEAEIVRGELMDLHKNGKKVVLITAPPLTIPGIIIYYTKKEPGQIRLIVDSNMVFTGEIREQGESACLFSCHQALVTLFKEAMINEIRLIGAPAPLNDIDLASQQGGNINGII
ncbi:MAG: helix-turn-helix domain-containing protein [Clostridiaceae bacterium]|nr:helix-turn-helix domain-containing protein [Clostridiaceae bacterium]